MVGRLAVLASVVVLVVSVVLAASRGASYTQDEVLRAFARQGFMLINARSAAEEGRPAGWTPYGGVVWPTGVGEVFFPTPEQNFFVYVAGNDLQAEQFFAPLAEAGVEPGVFDLLQGNVVVSSDASLTEPD